MLALRTAARQAGQHAAKRAPVVAAAATKQYSMLARAQTAGQRSAAVAAVPRSSALSFPSATAVRHFSIETTKVPSLGDSISEGTIVKWEANVGDFVDADGVLVVIETDKVSVDIRSPKAGVLKAQLVKAGETVKVGQDISQLDTEGKKPAGAAPAAAAPKAAAAAPAAAAKAAPAAAAPAAAAAPKAAAPAPAAAPKPTVAAPAPGSRSERKVPMTRMRQTIANRLKVAQNTAACLTTFNEIDMTNIMAVREQTQAKRDCGSMPPRRLNSVLTVCLSLSYVLCISPVSSATSTKTSSSRSTVQSSVLCLCSSRRPQRL